MRKQYLQEAIQLFDDQDQRSFNELYEGKEDLFQDNVDDLIAPKFRKLFEATYQTGNMSNKRLRESLNENGDCPECGGQGGDCVCELRECGLNYQTGNMSNKRLIESVQLREDTSSEFLETILDNWDHFIELVLPELAKQIPLATKKRIRAEVKDKSMKEVVKACLDELGVEGPEDVEELSQQDAGTLMAACFVAAEALKDFDGLKSVLSGGLKKLVEAKADYRRRLYEYERRGQYKRNIKKPTLFGGGVDEYFDRYADSPQNKKLGRAGQEYNNKKYKTPSKFIDKAEDVLYAASGFLRRLAGFIIGAVVGAAIPIANLFYVKWKTGIVADVSAEFAGRAVTDIGADVVGLGSQAINAEVLARTATVENLVLAIVLGLVLGTVGAAVAHLTDSQEEQFQRIFEGAKRKRRINEMAASSSWMNDDFDYEGSRNNRIKLEKINNVARYIHNYTDARDKQAIIELIHEWIDSGEASEVPNFLRYTIRMAKGTGWNKEIGKREIKEIEKSLIGLLSPSIKESEVRYGPANGYRELDNRNDGVPDGLNRPGIAGSNKTVRQSTPNHSSNAPLSRKFESIFKECERYDRPTGMNPSGDGVPAGHNRSGMSGSDPQTEQSTPGYSSNSKIFDK